MRAICYKFALVQQFKSNLYDSLKKYYHICNKIYEAIRKHKNVMHYKQYFEISMYI